MHFTLQYLAGETQEDILCLPARNKYFESNMTVQQVTLADVTGNSKGRSTYLLAMAHHKLPENIFSGNRVILIVDRPAPSDKELQDHYWSNIFKAEAIACDFGMEFYLKEHLPKLEKRILNLTGVVAGRNYKIGKRPKGSKKCVFIGKEDNGLWFNLKDCAEVAREGISWSLLENEKLSDYGIYVSPYAHSQLYLSTLASRCDLLIHAVKFEYSYNLDPRTNSISLGRLQNFLENDMLGSSGFETVRDLFYSDLSGAIESLNVNYYKPPIGDTLFDRVFCEINKSSFE